MRVLAVGPAALLLACGPDTGAGNDVTVRDSAGVHIVENTGPDRPLDWTFAVEQRLGGAPDGPQSFYRALRRLVAVDGHGRILVLHSDAHRVVRFTSDGAVDLLVGREGGGPGEFRRPVRVTAAHDGRFAIVDAARDRVIHFSDAGELVDEVATRTSGVALTATGYVSQRSHFTAEGFFRDLVHVQNADTVVLVTGPHSTQVRYRLSGRCGPSPQFINVPYFTPDLAWYVAGDLLAFAPGSRYAVVVQDGADELWRTERVLPLLEGTQQRALAVAEANPQRVLRGGEECVYPAEELVEARGFRDTIPRIVDMALRPNSGELWVERYTEDVPDSRIDVFDAEGRYAGTLPEGTPLPMHFLPDGRALLVETDEYDIQRIAIARVNR